MKVLITGAAGFIGRRLSTALLCRHDVVGSLWTPDEMHRCAEGIRTVLSGNIGPATDWNGHLDTVEVVVHLAGRAHILREAAPDSLAEFRSVNVAGTERLAREAARHGVRRFVFVSTVGVHGTHTQETAVTEASVTAPASVYALSKWEAELALHRIGAETGMEIVIVRPTLVYGPGVPGNFLSLLRLVSLGMPLPLGLAHNLRSFVGVENLSSFLTSCVELPMAAGETFLISDGEDISVVDLCRLLAAELRVHSCLLAVPPTVCRLLSSVLGWQESYNKLFLPFLVSSAKARARLHWLPACSLVDGLAATARWFAATSL